MSFTDKVVLVTGAGSGIGAATAIAFHIEGAQVALVDKHQARLENTAAKFVYTGKIPLQIKGDISIEKDVQHIIEVTISNFKRLDVLVNSAGIIHFSNVLEEDLLKKYDEIMNVNLRGTIHLTQLAIPYLIESKGNIINISSSVAPVAPGRQNVLCYGISKAALNYFSLDIAKELGPLGVRVNLVSPGPVRTNIMAHLGMDDWWERMESLTTLGRLSQPEEIAEVVLFIAKAKGIHGSNYEINNGFQF